MVHCIQCAQRHYPELCHPPSHRSPAAEAGAEGVKAALAVVAGCRRQHLLQQQKCLNAQIVLDLLLKKDLIVWLAQNCAYQHAKHLLHPVPVGVCLHDNRMMTTDGDQHIMQNPVLKGRSEVR